MPNALTASGGAGLDIDVIGSSAIDANLSPRTPERSYRGHCQRAVAVLDFTFENRTWVVVTRFKKTENFFSQEKVITKS